MNEFVFKLPDLGEGTVEAEIVEWHVKPGDRVTEADIIADVMTDKANVEVPAPVSGVVLRTSGQPGDTVAVGAELIAIDTAATGANQKAAQIEIPKVKEVVAQETPEMSAQTQAPVADPAVLKDSAKVITSPVVRRMALEAGITLSDVVGTGPRGRILKNDLQNYIAGDASIPHPSPSGGEPSQTEQGDTTELKIIGIRRIIAQRVSASKRDIPHFTYVEEVDVTALESLRQNLNQRNTDSHTARLSYLPFISMALMRALKSFPQCNALYDPEQGVIRQYERVHLGIATQTADGLKVPVVRNASLMALTELSSEIARVAGAARDNSATRTELTGSTVTITSLGKLGGIVTTPVINAPEVAIIGVNKAVERPVVVDSEVVIRRMMNLSASFDHRFIDGYDAAAMIQEMKSLLEEPGLIFVE